MDICSAYIYMQFITSAEKSEIKAHVKLLLVPFYRSGLLGPKGPERWTPSASIFELNRKKIIRVLLK